MSTEHASLRTAITDPLAQRAFWMRALQGATALPELHVKFGPECAIPSTPTDIFRELEGMLDGRDRPGEDKHSRRACCLASVLLVLHRYTNATDLIVGINPDNGYDSAPLENWLLPLRCLIRPEELIGAFCDQLIWNLEKMYQNQGVRRDALRWQLPFSATADGWPKLNIAILMDWSSDALPEPTAGGVVIAFSGSGANLKLSGRFATARFDVEGVQAFLDDVGSVARLISANHDRSVTEFFDLTFAESAFVRIAGAEGESLIDWSKLRTNFLATGDEVVVASGELSDPAALLAALQHRNAAILELSPYVMGELLAHGGASGSDRPCLDHLKLVVVQGERAPVTLVNEWLERYPNTPLAQTLFAAVGNPGVLIREPVPEPRLFVSFPAGCHMQVRTASGQLAAIGMPGEIWTTEATSVEGAGNLFSNQTGREHSWHSTGEWGKRLENGEVEWFGRASEQTIVRSRLDPIRLEAALAAHPEVRHCAVVCGRSATGGTKVTAFIVGRHGTQPGPAQLGDFAAQRLGERIEFQVILKDRFPLRQDGRVDRDALNNSENENGVARNAVDEVLADLWSEMLRVPKVGIHDDFFALGGHSVMAMQITARIRRIFQTDISLRNVFEIPSIAKISDMLVTLEKTPGQTEKLARMWQRARSMSAEEIKEILRRSKEPNQPGKAIARA